MAIRLKFALTRGKNRTHIKCHFKQLLNKGYILDKLTNKKKYIISFILYS